MVSAATVLAATALAPVPTSVPRLPLEVREKALLPVSERAG